MITRHARHVAGVLSALLPALLAVACEKSPLLAPTGSSISLTTATTALPNNGSTTIVAQVLEAAGTPPHSGTRVVFTTTLGVLEPADASTDSSGRATVTFRANGASGIAIIAASSGGATTSTTGTGTATEGGTTPTTDRSLRIAVGTAAIGRLNANANPAVLPTSGGIATIVANVLDINSNPLSNATVTFSTTAGTLSATTATTDGAGNASVSLTTFQQATVTVSVGVGSSGGTGGTGNGGAGGTGTQTSNSTATVVVSLKNAPTINITLPDPPPSQGLPAIYIFEVTPATSGTGGTGGNGTGTGTPVPIREVTVSWGDGLNSNLGAINKQSVSHTYTIAQTFTITATVTDVSGETARISTSVSVIPVPQLAIQVTPTPQTAPVNGLITATFQVTVPAGIGVQNTVIDFGDGDVRQLGGAVSGTPTKSYSTPGVRTITVAVLDTVGRTTIGTASVNITP